MKTQRKKRTIQTPASTGFYGLRAASVNAPTASYIANDAPSEEVQKVLKEGQQQLDEQNEKSKQDAAVYAQKRSEYLQQQQNKENIRKSRGNILSSIGSAIGGALGAEFGIPGMALGNVLGGLAGQGTEAIIDLF